ncbi:MAG: hypothetical protein ABJE10_14450 [bacterium]
MQRMNAKILNRALTMAASVALLSALSSPARAQLYASDATSVKGGDLMDRDYWRAKWDSMRLDEAIKERQPEGAILIAVIGENQLLDDLIKKYPNDQDFKTWKQHAEEIQGKISPNANRSDSFKPGSLWNETNYKEAYVNYNYAKAAMAKKDWAAAHDGFNYAERNLGFLTDRVKNNDRVSAWPDGAAKWVQDASADVAKLHAQVKAKLK